MIDIRTDNKKFNAMILAAMDSIHSRQLPNGAIPESDIREGIFNGFGYGINGPGTTCYCRSFLGHALANLQEFSTLRGYLDFLLKCQSHDGTFGVCYDVHNPLPLDQLKTDDPWLKYEIDSTGYFLWHMDEYVTQSQDMDFLRESWDAICAAGNAIVERMDSQVHLICGMEEIILVENHQEIMNPMGFMMQINGALLRGLRSVAHLAETLKKESHKLRYAHAADELAEAMENRFVDSYTDTYLVGMSQQGVPYHGAMYFTLFPPLMLNTWTPRHTRTFRQLLPCINGRDPSIPNGFWSNDFSVALENEQSYHRMFSGAGVMLGAYPLAIEMACHSDEDKLAEQWLQDYLTLVPDRHNLPPEHINTVAVGKELKGNFRLYPDESSFIDCGNLMHLSFFLKLVSDVMGLKLNPQAHSYEVAPLFLESLGAVAVHADVPWSESSLDYVIHSDSQTIDF